MLDVETVDAVDLVEFGLELIVRKGQSVRRERECMEEGCDEGVIVTADALPVIFDVLLFFMWLGSAP